MNLVNDQDLFLKDVIKLLQYAYSLGFQVTGGELLRTPEQQVIYINAGKSKTMNSYHLKRLAIDLQFFKGGQWLYDQATLEPLGKYWEQLSALNKWGGFWKNPVDTPHFERHV